MFPSNLSILSTALIVSLAAVWVERLSMILCVRGTFRVSRSSRAQASPPHPCNPSAILAQHGAGSEQSEVAGRCRFLGSTAASLWGLCLHTTSHSVSSSCCVWTGSEPFGWPLHGGWDDAWLTWASRLNRPGQAAKENLQPFHLGVLPIIPCSS